MAREILLSRGEVALVDDSDAAALSAFKWSLSAYPNGAKYAVRNDYRDGHTNTVSMHRQIMGAKGGEEVDHINGNGLDNRRKNLRVCTHAENQRNRKPSRLRRFKGTHFFGRGLSKPWAAQVTKGGRKRHLGYFATEDQAARAYDTVAKEAFGVFARLNFPEEVPCGI